MAIIYSYPTNTNILATDIIVGSSTVIVGGRPKNQTKSFKILDLTAYFASVLVPPGSYVPYTGAIGPVNLGVHNLTANSIIKAGGTNLQYLLADGSVSTGPVLTGFVPYIGATQAVDLGTQDLYTTGQISTTDFVAGNDIYVGSLTSPIRVGRGPGNNGKSTALGDLALSSVTTGDANTAIGVTALQATTSGNGNTAIGAQVLIVNTTGALNTAVGSQALRNNLVGNRNTAIGNNSLTLNTADDNTAVGYDSLGSNTSGANNVAIGVDSLKTNTTGSNNVAIGRSALLNNTTGGFNTAIGLQTQSLAQTAIANVSLGYGALLNNLIGNFNTALGYRALINNQADKNTAIGSSAMFSNQTGTFNTVVGQEVLRLNVAGSYNSILGNFAILNAEASYVSALGRDAGRFSSAANLTTASESIFVGFNSKSLNTTSTNEIVIGANAVGEGDNTTTIGHTTITSTRLRGAVKGGSFVKDGGTNVQFLMADGSVSTAPSLTGFVPYVGATQAVDLGAFNLTVNSISVGKGAGSGTKNTAIGNLALSSATIADFNTAVGYQASKNNISGNSLTAIGYNALSSNTTGSFNTAVGLSALLSNTVGEYNTAIGLVSLTTNISGNANIALGHSSLRLNTTGSYNTAIGFEALYSNITVSNSVAIGYQALRANTTGTLNTAIGYVALAGNTTGANNTAIGRATLSANTIGINNIGIGVNALFTNSTTSYNIGIGNSALSGPGNSNTIGIGYNAGTSSSVSFSTNSFNSIFIGDETKPPGNAETNQIVIGYQAIGAGSNTATLGNTSITTTRLRGAVQGGSFVKDSGTSSQYLMADGSVTTAQYKYNFSGSLTLTGTLTTTNLLTITIPANSLSDYLDLRSLMVQQSGPILDGFQIRVWHNSVNDFNTATRIANYAFGASGTDLFAQMTRKFSIQSGTLFGFSSVPSNATGEGSNANGALSIAFNTAIINYLFVSIQLNNVADTAILRNVNITT